MQLTKIVITGGPCAGKSSAMKAIQEEFSQKGYRVLFVPETATELISGGVAPWTCGSQVEYQTCLMKLQRKKEAVFEEAARTMGVEKVLLVCDRGALDGKAYVTEAEFAAMLKEIHSSEGDLRNGYDGIFHLMSAAKGATGSYSTANNAARTETAEQAAELDDKVIEAWRAHPYFRIIDNSTDFEEKLHRLIAEISAFLEETEA